MPRRGKRSSDGCGKVDQLGVTPEQHNKYLAMAHLAHAGLYSLMILGMMALFAAMLAIPSSGSNNPPPVFFFVLFLFIIAFNGMFAIPSFVACYALLKRKRWAKLATIIAGVMAAMVFPSGTAVSVYTFWFLFSEPGKLLYDQPVQTLPPPRPSWLKAGAPNQIEDQYVPPSGPPNWR